jgi:hypothetical protein
MCHKNYLNCNKIQDLSEKQSIKAIDVIHYNI